MASHVGRVCVCGVSVCVWHHIWAECVCVWHHMWAECVCVASVCVCGVTCVNVLFFFNTLSPSLCLVCIFEGMQPMVLHPFLKIGQRLYDSVSESFSSEAF